MCDMQGSSVKDTHHLNQEVPLSHIKQINNVRLQFSNCLKFNTLKHSQKKLQNQRSVAGNNYRSLYINGDFFSC